MTASPSTPQTRLIERLRLYGQAQRLAILTLLVEGPFSVSEIEARTGIGQPALSQQLGELRRAGIITSNRSARDVIYDYASSEERARALLILGLLDVTHAPPSVTGQSPRYGAHFASILP